MNYRLIEVNERWYVAFHCKAYRDFVIEFSQSFASKDEAEEAARTGKIKPLNTAGEK